MMDDSTIPIAVGLLWTNLPFILFRVSGVRALNHHWEWEETAPLLRWLKVAL